MIRPATPEELALLPARAARYPGAMVLVVDDGYMLVCLHAINAERALRHQDHALLERADAALAFTVRRVAAMSPALGYRPFTSSPSATRAVRATSALRDALPGARALATPRPSRATGMLADCR
jgi:hypothetical protein